MKEVNGYKVNPDLSVTILFGEKEIPAPKNSLIEFYKRLYPGFQDPKLYSQFTFSTFWNTASTTSRITFLSKFMQELIYKF